jgi:hypothetical protein
MCLRKENTKLAAGIYFYVTHPAPNLWSMGEKMKCVLALALFPSNYKCIT